MNTMKIYEKIVAGILITIVLSLFVLLVHNAIFNL